MSTSPSMSASSGMSTPSSMLTSSCKSEDSRTAYTGLLSPPDSPTDKPRTPYVTGAKFIAKKHVPPTTFQMAYHKHGRKVPKVTGDPSHIEWVLSHPPAPGVTHATYERCIDIAETLRIGDSCGAQVVLTSDGLVAKIYDPLYYRFYGSEFLEDEKNNVTDSADKHYITEAAAYAELVGTRLHGDITPEYHGSWTLTLPITVNGHDECREVRMILMEHVTGISMFDIEPETLTKKERDMIMIRLIEADIDLRFAGVRHDDLEPRNVMLSLTDPTLPYEDGVFRLCIIDFAIVHLSKDHGRKGPIPQVRNPLFHWIGQAWYSDWGWLPPREDAKEWMWEVWGHGGSGGKYVAVERDPESRFGKPMRTWKD